MPREGELGKLEWVPNEQIVSALDRALYASLRFVAPIGKRCVLAPPAGRRRAAILTLLPLLSSNPLDSCVGRESGNPPRLGAQANHGVLPLRNCGAQQGDVYRAGAGRTYQA